MAHLLLVPCDRCDIYFATGNKVSLDVAWAIVERSVILNYHACTAYSQIRTVTHEELIIDAYLLRAHPEQQPARYRTEFKSYCHRVPYT
jgi:hypothetical protein